MKSKPKTMRFTMLRPIVDAIARKHTGDACVAIDAALLTVPERIRNKRGKLVPSHWHRDLRKLAEVLRGGRPAFGIFAQGNSKLPFVSFSSLPGIGFCPGAGACISYCYSYRAWRYPAAFARQCQNAYLLQTPAGRTAILQALDRYRKLATADARLDFRLYVDGDFGSVADVEFWQVALIARPWLKAYGYSKSWSELLAYAGPWAPNYELNLSSGSLHDDATRALVNALPIARGDFIAVPMPAGYHVTSSMHGDREHQARLREAFAATGDTRKAFTCPGKCGACTPKGHACGSDRFRNIPIIIAVH